MRRQKEKNAKDLETVHTDRYVLNGENISTEKKTNIILDTLKSKSIKIILLFFSSILLWIIYLGILDYDTVVYKYNPLFVIIGIVAYIFVVKIIYKKLLPKIENNNFLPYIILRNILYNVRIYFSNI